MFLIHQFSAVRLLAYTSPGQDAVGSSGASGFSKTFPCVPNEFRVGCGQESRRSIPKGLGTMKGLGTWNNAEVLVSRSRENPSSRSESSLFLVVPEFEPKPDSPWTAFPVILVAL